MMTEVRSAKIENGVVVNVAIGKVKDFIECGPEVSIGWAFDGVKFSPQEEAVDLNERRTRKIAGLKEACSASIMSGYTSDALGSVHIYPNKTTDQINMMGSVTASLLPETSSDWTTPFWCADENGHWAFREHTSDQIQKAGQDGKSHVVVCQTRLAELTELVMRAENTDSLNNINWPPENS